MTYPLSKVSGPFFRAVLADRVGKVLAPPAATSAGRYHRAGQAALYLRPVCDWAKIAVSGYMREDQHPRVVVPVQVGEALVVDQRDEAACKRLGIDPALSALSWRTALAAGTEPPSWRNADAARAACADGLGECSRMIPGGWHLTLFRWNERGGPSVKVCGEPVAFTLSEGGAKWGL